MTAQVTRKSNLSVVEKPNFTIPDSTSIDVHNGLGATKPYNKATRQVQIATSGSSGSLGGGR